MNKVLTLVVCCTLFFSCKKNNAEVVPIVEEIQVNVSITHKVGSSNFNAANTYFNPNGEQYKLNRFQYYLSNFQLQKTGTTISEKENESYHLIKAEDATTTNFKFKVPKSEFNQLKFLIGVDSLRNVSGAQTGALDPLNGMFWTWNSGYIMAKLEGNSPQSAAVSNLVTYHIGGFSGVHNTLRWLSFPIPVNAIVNGQINLNIVCDINKFFNGVHVKRITDEAVMMNHGADAAKFADNYATMFSIQ